MKSSDVAREIAARNGAPVAKKVTANVVTDYRRTPILQTQGNAEAEARAYGRDEVLDGFFRRKQLHNLLDQMCCDAGMDTQEARTLHEKLDHAMDSDELEPPEDEEEPRAGRNKILHDALDELIAGDRKRRGVVAKDRSVAMDACCADCAAMDDMDARRKKICFSDCASQARWWKAARDARRQHEASHAGVH